jgi:pyruvate dehydrogenase E2 component (dihydrolipoamide acetyltransferase)
MAVKFQMPKLGLTMEEGLILEWLVPDGAEVTEGTPVLIVQTDKVDTEVEAPAAGRISHVGTVGESYPCGQQIAWLLATGEKAPAAESPTSASSASSASSATAATTAMPEATLVSAASAPVSLVTGGRAFVSPNARRVAHQLGVDITTVRGTGPNGRVISEDVELAHKNPRSIPAGQQATPTPRSAAPSGQPVLASFAASALAELIGIDLRTVPVTVGQRLERDDVVKHIRALIAQVPRETSTQAPPPKPKLQPPTQTPASITPLTGMRGVIASRMHESLRDMAQLTLTMDVDVDAVSADRAARKKIGAAPGYTDYVIAAAARALKEKSYVNSQIVDDGVAFLPDVHVGMAVALENGLVVPVIRNTNLLNINELAAETSRLATAARAGKLKLAELEGGTFSVTTLGMFGVDAFTPVINPPNTAILGVGRIHDDVKWVGEGTKAKPQRVQRLTLSLTWDHRAFDGAPAAEFCARVKELLENPAHITG